VLQDNRFPYSQERNSQAQKQKTECRCNRHSAPVQFDPKADEVPRLAYRFRQASQVIALLVAALGLVVLGGWAFDVPTLTCIRPTFQSMKVNTALCFLFLGAGLWLAHDDKRQRSRRILGLAVAIIAGATLAEYAFHVSLGIDQLLFRDTRIPSLSAYWSLFSCSAERRNSVYRCM
jgi:hypothetical protein